MLAGVCSGLAEYFQVDPVFVRLAFVVLTFIQGLGILLYLVLWVLMPGPDVAVGPPSSLRDNFRAMGDELRRMTDDVRGLFSRSQANPTPPVAPEPSPPSPPPPERLGRPNDGRYRRGVLAGGVLIVLGIFFLLANLGLLDWWRWDVFWPVALIGLGLLILVQRLRPRV